MDNDITDQPVQDGALRTAVELLREVPIGFAQIILQPSHLVGCVFIFGALWNSWVIASIGAVGCFAGILTAFALNYPRDERKNGLYGFNGALVGLACSYFYEISFPLVLFVLAGGMASAVVMNFMLRLGLKPLTFPFVSVTWLIFALLSVTGWNVATASHPPSEQGIVVLEALLRGAGQVLFQESLLTGLLFIGAITIRSPTQGLYAMLAVSIGLIGAFALEFPVNAINLGLFGYNGVLCAVLFAGSRIADLASAVAAIVLSVVIVRLFHVFDLPAFTFPFVLSSWLILWMRSHITGELNT